MKSIRDTCIEFFQNEDTRQDLKAVIQPLGGMLYNEIYPYLWFLCIYHDYLTFLVLAILFLLLRVLNHLGSFYLDSSLEI